MQNWKVWLKGLVAAAIGGAANSVALLIVDPMTFNFGEGIGRVKTVALTSALLSVAMYLQKSPLPNGKTIVVGLLLLALLAPTATVLAQQPRAYLFPVWDGTRYIWMRPAEVVTLLPLPPAPIPPKPRHWNQRLAWDATGAGYSMPPGALGAVVRVNGLTYLEGLDYRVSGNLIIPTADNWPDPAQTVVCADYDL